MSETPSSEETIGAQLSSQSTGRSQPQYEDLGGQGGPRNRIPSARVESRTEKHDPAVWPDNIVTWDGPDDPANPLNW